MTGANSKVTAKHLNRDAYLYIRQSTVRQVFENTRKYTATICSSAKGRCTGLAL